jgi:hypothetical protein
MDDLAAELTAKAEAGLEAATLESLLEQSGTPSTRLPESSASTQESGLYATSSSPAMPA